MRPARLILALVIAVGLLPPVWLRDPPATGKPSRIGEIIALEHRGARAGPFVLAGAWRIDGDPKMFGGFSALAALSGDRLIAASDGGKKIVFLRPDIGGPPPILSPFGPETDVNKIGADLESLTRDPESGMLWAAYEFSQSIRRFTPELVEDGAIRPSAMRDWGDNSGAEAFARLPDGRFIAIEEGATEFGGFAHRALVFPSDPVAGERPVAFRVGVPGGYRPVDLIAVDEDRALVLLRELVFGFPPRFATAIGELDTRSIAEGVQVDVTLLARLGDGFPADNYEGMALTDDGDRRHLWLISDDNLMSYQNTYLLKLRWDRERARQKARE